MRINQQKGTANAISFAAMVTVVEWRATDNEVPTVTSSLGAKSWIIYLSRHRWVKFGGPSATSSKEVGGFAVLGELAARAWDSMDRTVRS